MLVPVSGSSSLGGLTVTISLQDLCVQLLLVHFDFVKYVDSIARLFLVSHLVMTLWSKDWRHGAWFFHQVLRLLIDGWYFPKGHPWKRVSKVWEIPDISLLILESLGDKWIEFWPVAIVPACELFVFCVLLQLILPIPLGHRDLCLCCHDLCVYPLIGFVDLLELQFPFKVVRWLGRLTRLPLEKRFPQGIVAVVLNKGHWPSAWTSTGVGMFVVNVWLKSNCQQIKKGLTDGLAWMSWILL